MSYEDLGLQSARLFFQVREQYNRQVRTDIKKQIMGVAGTLQKDLKQIESLSGHSHTNVLHATLDEIKDNIIKIETLTQELDKPFLLFIVGNGKYGKSTLINALLGTGKEMAKTGQLPKTWKIDVFYGSNDSQAEIRYKDGRTVKKSFVETKKLIEDEEEKAADSEDKVQDLYNNRQSELKTKEAKLQFREKLRKEMLYVSDVTEVHWPVPEGPLLKKFRLVDTPGTNQHLNQNISTGVQATAADYYSKADGVIWMLAADKVASGSTKNDIDDTLKRFGGRTDNIIAVLNKKDAVIKNSGEQGLQRVIQEAKRIYGNIFTEIIPVSALQAFVAQKNGGGNLKELEESGLLSLLQAIDQRFYKRSLDIQVESKLIGTHSILRDISTIAEKFQIILNKEEARRQQISKAWQEEMEKFQKHAEEMIDKCFETQSQKVYQRAKQHEDTIWDLQNEQRQSFLETHVFQSSLFNRDLQQLINQLSQLLESARNMYVRESAFYEYPELQRESRSLATISGARVSGVTMHAETFSTESGELALGGAVAIGAAAILGPIGLIAGFVAQSDAFASVKKFLSKLFTNLASKITNQYIRQTNPIRSKLKDEFARMLKNADAQVIKVREDTFAGLYGCSENTPKILQELGEIQSDCRWMEKPLLVRDVLFGENTKYK